MGQGTYLDSTWVSALRAAAGVARRAVSSEGDVLRAVSQELRGLHLVGGVSLLKENGELEIRSRILSATAEHALERMTGIHIQGYRFAPSEVPAYQNVLTTGESRYYERRLPIIENLVPTHLRPLLPAILRLLGGDKPTIIAPLIASDEIIGAINVTAGWLTREHLPIVTSLADHVAIAISQVRAREKMATSLERERLRNQVAQTVTSALDLPVVLERVIELAVEVSDADAGAFALVEGDGETIVFPHTHGLPEGIRFPPTRRGEGLAWHMLETGKPLILDEYDDHELSIYEWAKHGLHAFLGLPLFVGQDPIGAMGLFKKGRGDPFHRDQLEMMQSIASMAAIAIKNAQLYREAQRSAEESHALIETSSSISTSLDLPRVLQMIAEQVRELLDADGSRIHMLDPSDNELKTLVADDPQATAMMDMSIQPSAGLVGHVLQTGEAMIVNDPTSDPRSLQVPGTPDEERECLSFAPLNIRQRPMGVMVVRRLGQHRPFLPSDLHLLTAFASHAAVAIENADLYGQIEKQAQRLEQQVVERTRDLALSEARYRGLVETSLTGILHLDPSGQVTYSNEVFAEMIGLPREEILGKDMHEAASQYVAEESREMVLERFGQRVAGERPLSEVYEVTFLRASGERVPTIFAVNLIADDEGEPQGITCLVLDISTRKSLETALRSERDRLEAILSNIGDAVFVTDPKGIIEYVNPAWERLNGFSQAEALGRNANLMRAPNTPQALFERMWQTILAGKSWSGELVNKRKDGTTYDAAVTITPIRDEADQILNFVAVQHDISALKEVDRLKSQFVSDVSHELRTPLTNIRLYVDLLGENPMSDRSPDYLQTLNRESQRLAHLIDDLLSLSRLEARATPFDPRPIQVGALLNNLAEDRRALAAEQQIDLQVDNAEAIPTAMGDERLLTQVFTNLLTNSMNYTPDGGRISIRTRLVEQHGEDWLVAEVEDTGLGIHPEERSKIFHRFFRGKASQATGAPGTGLGLAICKEIAELHGGDITLESEPGQGTKISVWLPLTATPEPEGQKAAG